VSPNFKTNIACTQTQPSQVRHLKPVHFVDTSIYSDMTCALSSRSLMRDEPLN